MGNVVSGGWLCALRRPTPRRSDLCGTRARRRFCGVSCAGRAPRLTSGEPGSILPVSDCFGEGKRWPFFARRLLRPVHDLARGGWWDWPRRPKAFWGRSPRRRRLKAARAGRVLAAAQPARSPYRGGVVWRPLRELPKTWAPRALASAWRVWGIPRPAGRVSYPGSNTPAPRTRAPPGACARGPLTR